MGKPAVRTLVLGIALPLHSLCAFAISGNAQVELAGAGRYEDLRLALEQDAASHPLATRDLHALCLAYSKTKRYNKLFPCLEQLEANIARGDKRTRLFGLDDATPVLDLMRSEAYLELANYPLAMAEAKKTLAWYQAEDSDDTDIKLNALALLSIAATLGGDRVEGEKYAEQLQQVGTFTLAGNGYVSVKAMALARAHMALGNFQKTIDALSQDRLFALHAFLDRLVSGALITGKNNWAWQELPRAFMLNRALRGIGKTAEAKQGYDQLLNVPQVKDNGEIYWLILFERGVIAESEGSVGEAIDFYKKAIEVIEQQRASINTETSKIGFVGDKQEVYERIIDALYARNEQKEAFEYIERSKSRALVDMLAAKQVAAIHHESNDETRRLLKQLDEVEPEIIAQVPVSATEGKSTQRAFAAQAMDRIKSAAPELGTLISVSSISVGELRGTLPATEALVQYYFQGTALYALVLTQSDIAMVRLNADGLTADVKKFRSLLQQQHDGAIGISNKLYDRLLRPIESRLGAKHSLLIIPHGILHYLPFAALNDGKQYLIEKYALHSLPSASVLKYLRPAQPKSREAMLVFGNPDLGNPKFDLPSAQVEAEKIARQTKLAKLLVRAQATETAFKAAAAQYPILHIASHGIFNTKKPLDSALLLAKDDANDGKLTAGELYSLKLNADLVTLSACETGLGQINNGDDVVGLTRGFIYAGSSSIVSSLWQVDDDATSELMTTFYAEFTRHSKIDALRTAQLEVKKKYPHPYFWSAFFLTGNAQ